MSGGPLPASTVCAKNEAFWNHACVLALFSAWSLRGVGCLHHLVSVFHGLRQFIAVWLLLITCIAFLSEIKPIYEIFPLEFKMFFHQGTWPEVSGY